MLGGRDLYVMMTTLQITLDLNPLDHEGQPYVSHQQHVVRLNIGIGVEDPQVPPIPYPCDPVHPGRKASVYLSEGDVFVSAPTVRRLRPTPMAKGPILT